MWIFTWYLYSFGGKHELSAAVIRNIQILQSPLMMRPGPVCVCACAQAHVWYSMTKRPAVQTVQKLLILRWNLTKRCSLSTAKTHHCSLWWVALSPEISLMPPATHTLQVTFLHVDLSSPQTPPPSPEGCSSLAQSSRALRYTVFVRALKMLQELAGAARTERGTGTFFLGSRKGRPQQLLLG